MDSKEKKQVEVLSSKEQFLGQPDKKYMEVYVSDWNANVRIQSLSGKERDEIEQFINERVQITRDAKGKVVRTHTDSRGIKAKVFVLCVVDPEGKRIFSDADIEKLQSKSGRAIEKVYQEASKFNGIGEDIDEETVKNS